MQPQRPSVLHLIFGLEPPPSLPVPCGEADGAAAEVMVQWSQRDLQRNCMRHSLHTTRLPGGRAPAFGWDLGGVLLMVPSPSGSKLLLFRKETDKAAAVLEVWAGACALSLAATVPVEPASLVHSHSPPQPQGSADGQTLNPKSKSCVVHKGKKLPEGINL